ncbi:MAG: hypothetical protein JRH08_13615 [Deltaproteobacteria bacterium]|nr:hypothetical protein [Deltaproteobacteria bacterium]MBW2026657.1 hypothetical protein [Deltaproteobacteria bacterium]MBW2126689.1 hypothetical protein [Deltaproteobacteria bacterium]
MKAVKAIQLPEQSGRGDIYYMGKGKSRLRSDRGMFGLRRAFLEIVGRTGA